MDQTWPEQGQGGPVRADHARTLPNIPYDVPPQAITSYLRTRLVEVQKRWRRRDGWWLDGQFREPTFKIPTLQLPRSLRHPSVRV